MYKYVGVGLLGLFLVMIFPSGLESIQDESEFYGAANILVRDVDGNEVFEQTIHNNLINTGETMLLEMVFQGLGTDRADNVQIGTICVSDGNTDSNNTVETAEGETAANFDDDNTFTTNACRQDTAATAAVQGEGVLSLVFEAGTGTNNVPAAGTVNGIAICQNLSADDNDHVRCDDPSGGGILFAVLTTSAVTLQSGETVTITYTLDLKSDSS